MRIGELAKATGTKAETIRYYERAGILPAADRTAGNYRDYSNEHLATLSFVRRARGLGFSTSQVKELLTLSDNDDKSCSDVDQLVRQQLKEVNRKIENLILLRDELSQMLQSCEASRIGDCQIVERLAQSTQVWR